MITEIGHYALVLALVLALVQSLVPVVGARRHDERMMAVAEPAAIVIFGFVLLAFLALVAAYVRSDFSVVNVFENSHSAKPLLFKVSGVWGNHEGSMLLWVLILTLFSALVAVFGGRLPPSLRATVLSVQAWVVVAFLLFILTTSNPFARQWPAPAEGQDLNPILQDIGLAIHPPLLYLGYVGISISFAFAVAALIEGRVDAAWARWVRPWTLAAWIFLTLGIAMGSYWAYYELGWGGFWFWDPVENASFMPWLAATALIHSASVMEKREALKLWTVLLALLSFSLSLLGTFLVRSGVLTSVHAFATDPARGVFILAILVVFIGGSFSLYAWRAPLLRAGGLFSPVSREGALVVNNLIITTACATVFVGTLYPLALEVTTGQKISVGSPFYNLTFVPLMIPALLLLPIGPMLAWKRADLSGIAERLGLAAVLALGAAAISFWLAGGQGILSALAVGIGIWIIVGSIAEPVTRAFRNRVPFKVGMQRLIGLPPAAFGTALGHLGIGLSVLGIAAASGYGTEVIRGLAPGESVEISGYTLRFDAAEPRQGPNFRADVARFTVFEGGREVGVMEPSKRLYTARQMPTTEAAILTRGLSQIYLSLGDPMPENRIAVRAYHKPLVTLIWIGALVMAIGGGLSLVDRRLRIGAPRRSAALRPGEARA